MLKNASWRQKFWPVILTVALGLMLLTPTANAQSANSEPAVHTVQPGDSLWKLALRYHVSMQAIRNANEITGDIIYTGDRLTIPTSASVSTAETSSGIRLTEAERQLLNRIVAAEATNQPLAGKVAVAAVVLNRVEDDRFPDSLRSVIYAPGQFQPVQNGWLWEVNVRADHKEAAALALKGWDPTGGALYFFNPAKTNNSFLWSRPHAVTIGGHRFVHAG